MSLFAVGLGGCSTFQIPAEWLVGDAEPAKAVVAGGYLTISDGKLTCGGGYNSEEETSSSPIAMQCTDGRTGSALVTSRVGRLTGTLRLDDGTHLGFADRRS
jgi:hypothetical protein